jgi:curli biogenesis system outer membrane secretion channel CsgG
MKHRLAFLIVLNLSWFILSSCAPTTATTPMASESLALYDGPIETLAIVLASGRSFSSYSDFAYDESVSNIYSSQYVRSRFDLVERQDTTKLLEEQGLIKGGFVDNDAGPEIGQLLGAKNVLIVEVTNATATYVSGSVFSILGLGGSGYNTDVRVSMRLIDSETGVVLGFSTGGANQLVADGISIVGINANVNDEEGAIISLLPAAIRAAIDQLLLQIA